SWSAQAPSGTTINFSARFGNTTPPDATWTSYVPLTGNPSLFTQTQSRYVQYTAAFAGDGTGTTTPVLQDITFVGGTRLAQDPLPVLAPTSAVFGTTFLASSSGGSGTGAVTYAASGVCSNLNGDAHVTMTSGTGTCSVTVTKAADIKYNSATS